MVSFFVKLLPCISLVFPVVFALAIFAEPKALAPLRDGVAPSSSAWRPTDFGDFDRFRPPGPRPRPGRQFPWCPPGRCYPNPCPYGHCYPPYVGGGGVGGRFGRGLDSSFLTTKHRVQDAIRESDGKPVSIEREGGRGYSENPTESDLRDNGRTKLGEVESQSSERTEHVGVFDHEPDLTTHEEGH